MSKRQKIIIILGQTATGKSALAVKLAKKFNGEIISADSRQVYKGLDIGTGKITKKEMRGIPHHMLDIISPRRIYTAAEYIKRAEKVFRYIETNKKIPIVVGGTGFYIKALLRDISFPNVPPNNALRKKLERKKVQSLFKELKKLDPRRARTIDKNNKVRLIRAIEIARVLGKVPDVKKIERKYNVLKIGIRIPDKILKQKIHTRLLKRLKQGMVEEARKLHQKKLSWKRMDELGLEYRYVTLCLQRKISKDEMTKRLNIAIWQYARRQKTWFKRDKEIKWFTLSRVGGFTPYQQKNIDSVVKKFLKL